MKKLILLILIFIIYCFIVNFCPSVTETDVKIINLLQLKCDFIPSYIPELFDSKLYAFFIALPLITGFIFFLRKYLLIDLVLFFSSPLTAYLLNVFIKNIIKRPRPSVDLQYSIHPSTYSFVSTHSLVTATLWGLAIYYIYRYCSNRILKFSAIIFSVFLIIFTGFCRILTGVHNPSDVIGGYLLGLILIYIYLKLIRLIGGKC